MNDSTEPRETTRRRRLKRAVIVVAAAVGAVLLLAAILASWLVATTSGASWLIDRVDGRLPGELEIERLDGSLVGVLTAEGIAWTSEGLEARIGELRLRLGLVVFDPTLVIEELQASGVEIVRSPAVDEPPGDEEPFSLEPPVAVRIEQAEVTGIRIRSTGEPEPLPLERLQLAGMLEEDGRAEIEELIASGEPFLVSVRGETRLAGDYATDLVTEWHYEPTTGETIRGEGELHGDREQLRLEQRVVEPLRAELDATLSSLFDDASLRATLRVPQLDLQKLDSTWPGTAWRLEAEVSGQLEGELRIERATLVALDGSLEARGTIDTGDPLAWQLELEGSGLDPSELWPEYPGRLSFLLSSEGRLAEAGIATTVELAHLDGELRDRGVAGNGTLRIEEGGDRLFARPLEIVWGRARLRVEGEVAERVDARFELEVPRLAALLPDSSGRLAVEGRIEGPRDAPAVTASVDAGELRTVLEGGTVVRLGSGRATVDLDLDSLAGEIELAGSDLAWGEPLLARFDVALLGDLADHRLTVDLRTVEARGEARVEARLDGGLALVDTAAGIEELSGVDDLDPLGDSRWQGTLERLSLTSPRLPEGRLGEPVALELRIADGAPASGELSRLCWRSDDSSLCAQGSWSGSTQWQGTVELSSFALALLEPLLEPEHELPGVVDGRLELTDDPEGASAELSDLCWRAEDSRLCADGSWSETGGWRLTAEMSRLDLRRIEPWLTSDVELTGVLEGRLEATGEGTTVTRADVRVLGSEPGRLTLRSDGDATVIEYSRFESELQVDDAGARLDATLAALGDDRVELGLALPGYRSLGMPPGDQKVEGSLTAEIDDLDRLAETVPALDPRAGVVDVDLGLAGTVGDPRLTGSATLREGVIQIPELGVTAREVEITAERTAGDELRLSGRLSSGDGVLRAEGTLPLPLPLDADTPLRLSLEGENVLVIDRPDLRAVATPDLELTWGERLHVEGTVRVPQATILEPEGGTDAIEPSPDLVVVADGSAAEQEDEGFGLSARIELVLGDEVSFRGYGLDVEPTGSLRIVESPDAPTEAYGSLDLGEGSFKMYGVRLDIDHGELVFTGPVTSPRIDIRASRTAPDGVVAGLEATGPVEQPRIDLWSQPPMEETEQLSYLLLGRPVSGVGAGEGDLLTGAAQSLGVRGGAMLARELSDVLGLEEVRIDTERGTEEAALVLGDYLAPDLYVGYGLGLFDAESTFLVRYLVTDALTVEATLGDDTAADVLYSFEAGTGGRDAVEDEGESEDDEEEEADGEIESDDGTRSDPPPLHRDP